MIFAVQFIRVLQLLFKHRLLLIQDTLHLLLTPLFKFAGRVADLGRQRDDRDEAAASHDNLIQLVVLTDTLSDDGADIKEGNHDGCSQDDVIYAQVDFSDLRHKPADHPGQGAFQ